MGRVWAVAACSLLLCGFGIYLGRFLRLNSWDVFVHPLRLLEVIAAQFSTSDSQPLLVTLVFGGGLMVGYLVLGVFSVYSFQPASYFDQNVS